MLGVVKLTNSATLLFWRLSIAVAIVGLVSESVLIVAECILDAKSGLGLTIVGRIYWVCLIGAFILGSLSYWRASSTSEEVRQRKLSLILNLGVVTSMLVPFLIFR